MDLPFSKLNDFAHILANILRDFNPDTMFWRKNSPILFSNADQDGFTPNSTIAKPFGIQRILEALAKSCGFNSYKALLSDEAILRNPDHRLKVDLYTLNPNPRSPYYQEYWNTFIDDISLSIYLDLLYPVKGSSLLPSYLTYRNFKRSKLSQVMPYMGYGMASISEVAFFRNKKAVESYLILKFSPRHSRNDIACFYPIAASILMTAIDKGLTVHTDKSHLSPEMDKLLSSPLMAGKSDLRRLYEKTTLSFGNVPLREFLVHDQWEHDDFKTFSESLIEAMDSFFNIKLKFSGRSRNPLDKLVSLDIPFDVLYDLAYAELTALLHDRMKDIVLKLSNSIVDDKSYYIHNHVELSSLLQENAFPEEFSWIAFSQISQSNDISKNKLYGTKSFWLNHSLNILRHIRRMDFQYLAQRTDSQLTSLIEQHVLGELTPYQAPQVIKPNYAYQFSISGISKFVSEYTQSYLKNSFWLPKTITINSEVELEENIAKLAVQAQLLKMMPNDLNSNLTIFEKQMGNPGVFIFDELRDGGIEPKLIIKRLTTQKKTEIAVDFHISQIINSITIIRNLYEDEEIIQSESVDNSPLNPSSPFFESDNVPSLKELLFEYYERESGEKQFYCILSLDLIDTVYKARVPYCSDSGWNNMQIFCMTTNLGDEPNEDMGIHLQYCYDDEDESSYHPDRLDKYMEFVQFLNSSDQFKQFLKSYLIQINKDWKTKINHQQFTSFEPLYQISDCLKYYPNSME